MSGYGGGGGGGYINEPGYGAPENYGGDGVGRFGGPGSQQGGYGGSDYGRPQQDRYGGSPNYPSGYGGGNEYGRPYGGGDDYARFPQSGYGGGDYGRPPHSGGDDYGRRPHGGSGEYGRPAQGGYEGGERRHGSAGSDVQGQVVKIFCEANPEFCLTVKNDQLVLAPGDGTAPEQQFVKDAKWGSRVQDSAGFGAFAIVHKASGLALKHGNAMNDRVTLAPYDGEALEESLLWTLSADVGDGYQCLRPVGDIHLNLDALHGEQGISKPTELIIFKWKKQANQKWKMEPIGGSGGGYSDY